MDEINYRLLRILQKNGTRMSTYAIHKASGFGWSTTKTHLLDLQLAGKIDTAKIDFYTTHKIVWWAL